MSDAVAQSGSSAVTRPPLAKGPLPKPEHMKRGLLKYLRFWSLPILGASALTYVAGYFLIYERHRTRYNNYLTNLDPDKLYEEIKEYGGFKSAKASWQK